VVDVVKPISPNISERRLFVWAKIPMAIAAAIAAAIVLTGVDFVTIVLTSYAIRTALLIPLMLSLFWPRITASGFVGGIVAAIAIGMPIRAFYGELWGSIAILSISTAIPLVLGLLSDKKFDFASLKNRRDATETTAMRAQPFAVPAGE
jgi:urea-proton symporter